MKDEPTHSYSLDDIERYIQGTMDAPAMHALEKAALNDPLLADAIEGLRNASLAKTREHLAMIESSLRQSKVVKTQTPLVNAWRSSLRVAAVLVLVVAATWITIAITDRSKSKNTVADTNTSVKKEKQQDDSQVAPITADTVAPKQLVAAAKRPAAKKQALKKTAATPPPVRNESGIADPSPAVRAFAFSRKTADTLTATFYEIRGKLLDGNHEPIPNAVVTLHGNNLVTITDFNGAFTVKSRDTVIAATINALGFEQKTIQLNSNDSNHVYLKLKQAGNTEQAIDSSAQQQP